MTTPKFFKHFNDIQYAYKADRAGNLEYLTFKDVFRSLVIREDIFAEDTLYDTYVVQNGERPDQISYEMYGDEKYYWVILQVNGIVDYWSEWPLSDQELEEFVLRKYGSFAEAEQVRHYETVETRDADGNLVLPGGLKVASDYVFTYPSTPGENARLSSLPVEVTYLDHERYLNDEKKEIQILSKRYVSDYVREYKKYVKNAQSQKSEVGLREIQDAL